MKKAQGLSMRMIVVAAIALLVMVVLIFMFYGRAKMFGASTSSCTEKRGECTAAKDCVGSIIGQMDCPEEEICCVTFGGGGEG